MSKRWGHRRSLRLQNYDYSQEGVYFVTLLTRERRRFFEDPLLRRIAEANYLRLPEHFPTVTADTWVVMTDHVHLLIQLHPPEQITSPPETAVRAHVRAHVRAQFNCALTTPAPAVGASPIPGGASPIGRGFPVDPLHPTLGQVIRSYKARVTRRIHQAGEDHFQWHRNYYERVIRNERELNAVREYIRSNPERLLLTRDETVGGSAK